MFKKTIRALIPDRWRDSFRIWKRTRILNSKTRPTSLIGKVKPAWRMRIDEVIACPDNAFIPRVAKAGVVEGDVITMHNGIRIKALSYYGGPMMNMLIENKGVHEPQEERAFAEVLSHLPADPVSLELGAYWGFYSLWLKTGRPAAHCHLVESDEAGLQDGRINFEMNGLTAEFEQSFVSDTDTQPPRGPRTISVDGYCRRKQIPHLHVLHSDIQGYELKMLNGARELFSRKAIDYVFISTHSVELHRQCIEQLVAFGYEILCAADLPETYSGDGLIVAKSPLVLQPSRLEISKKPIP